LESRGIYQGSDAVYIIRTVTLCGTIASMYDYSMRHIGLSLLSISQEHFNELVSSLTDTQTGRENVEIA